MELHDFSQSPYKYSQNLFGLLMQDYTEYMKHFNLTELIVNCWGPYVKICF